MSNKLDMWYEKYHITEAMDGYVYINGKGYYCGDIEKIYFEIINNIPTIICISEYNTGTIEYRNDEWIYLKHESSYLYHDQTGIIMWNKYSNSPDFCGWNNKKYSYIYKITDNITITFKMGLAMRRTCNAPLIILKHKLLELRRDIPEVECVTLSDQYIHVKTRDFNLTISKNDLSYINK